MDSGDIAAWLTQILDEDEALANEAATSSGTYDPQWSVREWPYEGIGVYGAEDGGGFQDAQTRHIERHDPAAVLADIAAKRAILASEIAPYPEGHAPMTRTLRLLASAYRDRPGYCEEWKPGVLR